MRVVATAGHVDHGKSTLVLALTGTDPDRLAEEKARGLTIDLGFAAGQLPSGAEIAFVDVPGHVRFIKNMLAGVGAVDACLFVVAATEGWKPQSEEHLRILELLGIEHGLIALTKVGLVDDEWRQIVELEIQDRVAGTFLAGAEVVAVDAVAGIGIDALRSALDRLVADTPAATDRGWPRLWVDRSFPVRGAGTVATGTLTGGSFGLDDEVAIEPGGLTARVRRLHSHHVDLDRAGPGRRLAINLAGVSHDHVARGQAVVRPGQWHRANVVDASLTVLASVGHRVSRRGAYAAYLGSGEHPVKVRVLGPGGSIAPGEEGFVRLWLAPGTTLPLLPGDRYVLREAGRAETVGGGEVVDVAPVLPASRARPSRSVDRVIAERGWVDATEAERLTGVAVAPNLGRWAVDPAVLDAARTSLVDAVVAAGAEGIDVAKLNERQRALLVAGLDGVELDGNRAVAAGLGRSPMPPEAVALLAALEAAPWSPPDIGPADRAALRELHRRGLAVQVGPLWFATSAVADAAAIVARLLTGSPDGLSVGAVRDALGASRKHVVPLLEHFDATGITRRRGDVRIGGPRLPQAAPP